LWRLLLKVLQYGIGTLSLSRREGLSLPQREGHHDHKSQTEQKRTSEEIRPNGCRLFIHFGLFLLFFLFTFF